MGRRRKAAAEAAPRVRLYAGLPMAMLFLSTDVRASMNAADRTALAALRGVAPRYRARITSLFGDGKRYKEKMKARLRPPRHMHDARSGLTSISLLCPVWCQHRASLPVSGTDANCVHASLSFSPCRLSSRSSFSLQVALMSYVCFADRGGLLRLAHSFGSENLSEVNIWQNHMFTFETFSLPKE